MSDLKQAHWDSVYGTRAVTDVSWYEAQPNKSLQLIRSSGVQPGDAIIDVGGGASFLTEALLALGYRDLTVLDISTTVLDKLRDRLSADGSNVALLQADVTTFRAPRRYALWHDRAVFHFLTQADERQNYVQALKSALQANGQVIIATFGPAGPQRCSGLPVVRYDAATLANEFGSEFRLVESCIELHHTPSGVAQQFLHCRFQLEKS